MEVTFISLTTALSLCLNIIYERPTLIAVYCINLLVTVSNFYLILVPHPASTTYKDKAIINILWEPLPVYHQKVYPRVKSLFRTALLRNLIKYIRYYKP